MENKKEQLNRENDDRLKNFGYGSIMISFYLDKIPLLIPQHIELGLPNHRGPWMRQWVDLMSRHEGVSLMIFTPTPYGYGYNSL